MTRSSEIVLKDDDRYSEFTTEALTIDTETAIEIIMDTLGGVTATRTEAGVKLRSMDGMLLAILAAGADDSPVEVHYRTAPASETATLKARKLWRALEPYSA
jgi:hypothetical protein